MEHDGSSHNQNVPPSALTHGIAGPAATHGSTDVTLPSSMEHDGLPTTPSTPLPSVSAHGIRDSAANTDPASATPSGSTANRGAGSASRRRNSISLDNNRILCPVAGCPKALASSNKHFRDFAAIRSHLNEHCTGHLSGAIPVDFLSHYDFTQCIICDKILHKRYSPICPKCRPRAHVQQQMHIMRSRVNSSDNRPSIG